MLVKEFEQISQILNNSGYKPYNIKDGVHEEIDGNDEACIYFLSTSQIYKFIAIYMRDKDFFNINIASAPARAFKIDNLEVTGNSYSVYFQNTKDEILSYFRRILDGIISEEIEVDAAEENFIVSIDEILDEYKNSKLNYLISFNCKDSASENNKIYNRISISNKKSNDHGFMDFDFTDLGNLLSKKFLIPFIQENEFETYENSICVSDNLNILNIYLTDDFIRKYCVNIIRECEKNESNIPISNIYWLPDNLNMSELLKRTKKF